MCCLEKKAAAPQLNKLDCKCGVETTTRIIGGSAVVKPNKYPWMAAIINTNAGSIRDRAYCGGSLVASKYVLTAAHCLFKDATGAQTMPEEAANVQVRLGDHDLSTEMETDLTLEQKTINV